MRNVTVRNVTRRIVPSTYGEHPWRIVTSQPEPGSVIGGRVQRWDIYDAADNLSDIPALIARHAGDPAKLRVIARYIQIMAGQMFDMADRGGSVGPSSTGYADVPAVSQRTETDELLDSILDAPLLNEQGAIVPLRWDAFGKPTPHQL